MQNGGLNRSRGTEQKHSSAYGGDCVSIIAAALEMLWILTVGYAGVQGVPEPNYVVYVSGLYVSHDTYPSVDASDKLAAAKHPASGGGSGHEYW